MQSVRCTYSREEIINGRVIYKEKMTASRPEKCQGKSDRGGYPLSKKVLAVYVIAEKV